VVIVSFRARWFDGRRSTAHAVRVSLEGELLRIRADVDDESASQVLADVPQERLTIAERFATAPRMIELPDGGSLQVEDDASGGFDALLQQAGHRPGPVFRLIDRWRNVLVCLVLLIGVIVWMDLQGAGLMASFVIRFVPSSVDARIGRSALAVADARWLAPSSIPLTRREAIAGRFSQLAHQQYPGLTWRLEFRRTRGGIDGFNAFAFPGGTIVLLDDLVYGMDDGEVLAVLGHELGHVVHRDVMHGIARQMGLLAVAGVVWGQMSSLAAWVASGVQGLHFARDAESDADAFAVMFLRRAGIPVRRLADAFAVMQSQERSTGTVPAFLSDHPSTTVRLRAAEAAAAGGGSAISLAELAPIPRTFGGVTLGMTATELLRSKGAPLKREGNDWLYDSIDPAHYGLLDVYLDEPRSPRPARVWGILFSGQREAEPQGVANLLKFSREDLEIRYGIPVSEQHAAPDFQYLYFRNGLMVSLRSDKVRAYGIYETPPSTREQAGGEAPPR